MRLLLIFLNEATEWSYPISCKNIIFAFIITVNSIVVLANLKNRQQIMVTQDNKSNSMPKVSVIMPAYNQAEYIADALDSLLNQTYSNFEVAIVDDGSKDNVAEIAKRYEEKDNRIKFYHTENHGVSAARNFAVANTTGELIIPLDADDIFRPEYLELCVRQFVENPLTRVAYCEWEYFGTETHAPKLHYEGYKRLFVHNTIFCSGMYWRKDFERVGGYDESMMLGFEDWEFWMRLLDENAVVYQIPRKLFRYRIKKSSRNVSANSEENLNKGFDYIFQKHRATYDSLYGNALRNLMHLEYYKYRNDKWKNRNIFSRLWHAVKGTI